MEETLPSRTVAQTLKHPRQTRNLVASSLPKVSCTAPQHQKQARAPGFEPGMVDPKSTALPLGHARMMLECCLCHADTCQCEHQQSNAPSVVYHMRVCGASVNISRSSLRTPGRLDKRRGALYTADCGLWGTSHAPQSSFALVAEWYTQQLEGLCQQWRGGSSPLEGTHSSLFADDAPGLLSGASHCI